LSRAIAIVGLAGQSRDRAPFHDPEWELWGLNSVWHQVPRGVKWDRYFELHDLTTSKLARLSRLKCQIYQRRNFPFTEIMEEFDKPKPYFTSTPAWMMAFAMLLMREEEGRKRIGLWGIQMEERIEYNKQRGCLEYLIGRAVERGIEIVLPKGCLLMRGRLYASDCRVAI